MVDTFWVTSGASSNGDPHITMLNMNGEVLHSYVNGTLIDGVGGAVDPVSGYAYWTNFSHGTVTRMPPDFSGVEVFISDTGYSRGIGDNPESLVIRGDRFLVGHADAGPSPYRRRGIAEWDRNGNFVTAYYPIVGRRGTDWISLAPDDRTLFYTSEDGTIRRYDLVNRTQLTDFASPGGVLFAVLVRQSDEHVFVTGNRIVYHYGSTGQLLKTFAPKPTPETLFAACLSLDERTLFTGEYNGHRLWAIDIATGVGLEAPFATLPSYASGVGGIFSLGGMVQYEGGWSVGRISV